MKITSFSPLIITKNMDSAVKLFEEIGFERRHKKEGIGEKDVTAVQLRNADGFDLDISQFEGLPVESVVSIRMNVDDFDETYDMLIKRGFKNFYGDKTADTPSSKSAVMISPSGFTINIVKHIK